MPEVEKGAYELLMEQNVAEKEAMFDSLFPKAELSLSVVVKISSAVISFYSDLFVYQFVFKTRLESTMSSEIGRAHV